MEPIFKLKQEGRDARFEYDALFKVWHILTGFSRPNYMAPELKPKQLEAIQTGDISLPGKCKGKPLRFAADLFDDQDIELLRKYEFFTAKETVYLVNMSPREYLRADCLHVDALMSHLATRHRREYSMQRTSGVVTAIKSCPVKLPTEKPLPPVPPPGSAGKTPQKQGSFYTKELPKELQLSPNSDNDQTAPDANAFVYSVTNYYDNAVVVPFSIPFEYSLHSSIVGTEGPAALEEYFQANPRHISLKQSLLQEVAHSALGLWVFYTLELIDPEASTLGSGGDTATVQTGLSGAQFNTEFGLIRAFTVLDGTCAPAAAGYVDKDIERGFISAQVANYDELVEAHGDLNLLKREKKIRQQGKKYAINGGDIISFDYYTPLQLAEQAQSLAGSSGAAK